MHSQRPESRGYSADYARNSPRASTAERLNSFDSLDNPSELDFCSRRSQPLPSKTNPTAYLVPKNQQSQPNFSDSKPDAGTAPDCVAVADDEYESNGEWFGGCSKSAPSTHYVTDRRTVEDLDEYERASSYEPYVEAIIDKKGHGPTARYLVKWLGYDESTWEAPWDLDNCIKLVDKFEKSLVNRTSAGAPSNDARHSTAISNTDVVSATLTPTYPQQMTIPVAYPGLSGVERCQTVVAILAHKPKMLEITQLEDVDFLVNYAGESLNEFVSYEACLRFVPAHLANYLSTHSVLPR